MILTSWDPNKRKTWKCDTLITSGLDRLLKDAKLFHDLTSSLKNVVNVTRKVNLLQ